MRELGIIGAGGHGRVAADIAMRNGYDTIVFYDDDRSLKCSGRFPVAGTSEDALTAAGEVFVAIGDGPTRQRFLTVLERSGASIAALVHPMASVAEDVIIGPGSVVMAGAVINPGAVIGKGCIVNSNAVVEHDCVVGDYVHIAPGAILSGTVHVGVGTWIGVGAAVRNNVSIAGDCMIGMGAVVTENIEKAGTYYGVPARRKEEARKMGGYFQTEINLLCSLQYMRRRVA